MLGMLHCLVGRRRKMNVKNKMIIYNVIVETLMLYAVPVRCNTTASNILSLERIQNKNVKMIMNAKPRDIIIDLDRRLN